MPSLNFTFVARRRAPILSALIVLAFNAPALAQVASDQAQQLPQIVVTPTLIPTPEKEVASSITVITSADMEAKQQRTVPDALEEVPGLNVVQTGGPGGTTSVYMRGANANQTKVYIDGIDASDPSAPDGSFDFGQLLTSGIDRIEILRGPQSGLYGSSAIGGVINIITKSGSGPAQFNVGVEAGSFDTFNQTAALSGSLDQFHYAATVEHFHSGETPVTPLDLLAPGEQRIDDYYDNLTASTKLGFDVTENLDLRLVARYTDAHLRLTGENENNFPADFPESAQSENDTLQTYPRATAHLLSFAGDLEQTLGPVGTAVEDHVLDALAQLRVDLLVLRQLAGVDDRHVEPGGDRVVEENGVDRLTQRFVAAERERHV